MWSIIYLALFNIFDVWKHTDFCHLSVSVCELMILHVSISVVIAIIS